MKSAVLCLTLLAAVLACVEARSVEGRAPTEYCYSTDTQREQYYRFNTKTAYQLIKGGGEGVVAPSGCSPSKFWLLSRHGTRLPGTSKIEKLETLPTYHAEILKNYENGKQPSVGGLCAADLELLKTWKWDSNITSEKDEWLTVQGWNDLQLLAKHYKSQYPTLFPAYSSDKYVFRHTNTQRTEASYKAFVEGLFGEGAYQSLPAVTIPENDYLLRPFDQCSYWNDQVVALDKSSSELTKFEEGTIYTQMAKDISTKLGYSSALKSNRIKWMFEMCFYEKAWNLDQESPWCTLFTKNEALIFEYAKDIEEWNLGGSATTLNKRLPCELVQDFINKIENGPMVTAYFAHSTTIQLFLTGLGYAHLDTPLRADNMEANANRVWYTSKICPLTSNVAIVRYDCADGIKVQFMHNERPLLLDFCDNGLCKWEDVKAKYAEFTAATCSSYFCTKS